MKDSKPGSAQATSVRYDSKLSSAQATSVRHDSKPSSAHAPDSSNDGHDSKQSSTQASDIPTEAPLLKLTTDRIPVVNLSPVHATNSNEGQHSEVISETISQKASPTPACSHAGATARATFETNPMINEPDVQHSRHNSLEVKAQRMVRVHGSLGMWLCTLH